jgi:DNA adenine methylase
MSGNRNKLIAFNYFGGKFTWVDLLIQHFPPHVHFVDLFCGSMAVTLNKRPSPIETANDLNSEDVTFFRVLRESPQELIWLLNLTPVIREEYKGAWHAKSRGLSDLEKARRFYIRVRQSFYGLGAQRLNKGWHLTVTKTLTRVSETISRWNNGIDKLWPVVERLRGVQIENKDFRELIPAIDYDKMFFYCDPPYPKECRSGKNDDYEHDFTDDDHRDLARLLNAIKGKAMISSYDCPLMRELYAGWTKVELPTKKNGLRSDNVIECIWMNYTPPTTILKLF